MAIDARVTELTRRLVAVDSVNPSIDPAHAGEAELAALIAAELRAAGLEVHAVGDAARPSLVAVRRGTGGGRTLLLNGHLDTVGVAGYRGDPFDARVQGGRLHGRGAYDMKAGLAAAIAAAERLAGAPLRGDLVLALVADEEYGSIGTEQALAELAARGIRPDAAIVLEPTGLDATVAHRGFAWYRLEVEGAAAHGSQPEQGVDAIEAALRYAEALRVLDARLAAAPPHPLLGRSTLRIATIDGGVDAATVAPSCTLTIERRTLPGEHPDAVRRELEDALATAEVAPGIRHRLDELVSRAAFELDERGRTGILAAVDRAAERVLGRAPARRGDPWWTDAGLIAEAGTPVVLIGAGGGGAHADEEWVELADAGALAELLVAVASDVCG